MCGFYMFKHCISCTLGMRWTPVQAGAVMRGVDRGAVQGAHSGAALCHTGGSLGDSLPTGGEVTARGVIDYWGIGDRGREDTA